MSYHSLSECTLTPDERREEANRIIHILDDVDKDKFTETEHKFLMGVGQGGFVTVKQLFWLRDIKDKYL